MEVLARLHIAACLMLLLATAIVDAASDEANPPSAAHSEYEIKGAMLYNFTKFIEWPEGVLGETGAPLIVGVLGNDGFGHALDGVLRGRAFMGTPSR
jgi:hypothetical protein